MYNPPLVRKRKSTITITPQQQAVVDPNLLPPNVVEPKMVEPKVVDTSKMPGSLKVLFDKISNHSKMGSYNFPVPKGVFGVGRLIVVCWVDFEDIWKCNMATEPIMSLYQV
jgi:hypothetical protein